MASLLSFPYPGSIRSATIHNLESAKLSMPPLLVPVAALVSESPSLREEEEEEGKGNSESHHEQAVSGYTWRTNLAKTERYWTGTCRKRILGRNIGSNDYIGYLKTMIVFVGIHWFSLKLS